MAPSASARHRTRWIQGSIIAASAVVIIAATVNIAERSARPTGQTPLPVVPSTRILESSTAPTEQPSPAEQPVPVVASATVEAPPTTTAAAVPVIVTYENCAAVWAALGGPIHRGDPGYNSELDTDDDGTGCEHRPR